MIIDFGKNTYEHRIEFGFDCVPAQFVREVVSSLLVEKNAFASVSKDVSTGDSLTVLTKGTGSEDAPFHQLKFARDKVILWCGWHTPYEHWQKWRSELLPDILAGLAKMPNEFVSAFVSQGISSVPFQRLKRAEVVPELEPIRQLYRRFLPPDLLKRGSGASRFSDEEGDHIVEWSAVVNPVLPNEEAFTFTLREKFVEGRTQTLKDGLRTHLVQFEKLLEGFHSTLLSPVIKR